MRDVAVTGNVVRDARVGISVTNAADAGKCLIANNLISNAKDGAIREMDRGVFQARTSCASPAHRTAFTWWRTSRCDATPDKEKNILGL
jgi:hypothetical protein